MQSNYEGIIFDAKQWTSSTSGKYGCAFRLVNPEQNMTIGLRTDKQELGETVFKGSGKKVVAVVSVEDGFGKGPVMILKDVVISGEK